MPRRTRLVTGLAVAAALSAPAAAVAADADATRTFTPVAVIDAPGFPDVLATRAGQALYWWTSDRPGKVNCTGACAEAWPPLYVPKGATVATKVRGVKGTFGTVRRPGGRRQVTYQGYPIYTYAHENRREVRCNDVNGWFVARARGLR